MPGLCDHGEVPRPPELPSQRVIADMRRRIVDESEWQPGDQMPSTREVAEHYGISTRTATRVYAALAEEGLVVVTPSWGTHRA